MISTKDLSRLPSIDDLKRLTQSLAMLDAIIQPALDFRCHAFDCAWADGAQLAWMRNGGGDEWFCGFGQAGALLKGFDHESKMSPWRSDPPAIWPGVVDNVPVALQHFLANPDFSLDDTTFCIWRERGDAAWQHGAIELPPGDDPDGSAYLLQMLDGRPETYANWSEEYYERKIDLSAVQWIYAHKPLTLDIARTLNAEIDPADLRDDAESIGYPTREE
jgi:hypothetical protein